MLDELWSWIQTLEPPFLFLLILPFVVGRLPGLSIPRATRMGVATPGPCVEENS